MKDIKGYEGLYGVTDDGYVFSHKRGKYLRPSTSKEGRNVVTLYKDGEKKQVFVSVLVAEAFLPNKDLLPYVEHKGSITDDRAEMLRWASSPMKKKWRAGVYDGIRGEGNVNAKLTEEAVGEIRRSDECLKVLAERYGVSMATIHNVQKYIVWKHLP